MKPNDDSKTVSTNTADQLTTHLISPNPPVSEHFLTNDHSPDDITLIPLELIKTNYIPISLLEGSTPPPGRLLNSVTASKHYLWDS